MDTSRGAANSAILDCLDRAGSTGLHIDDLIRYLKFEERKQILPRLYDLQGRDLVERLPGQKWRIVESNARIIAEEIPVQLSSQTFVSYKNSLQEYCQKRHLPVPTYRVERVDYGFIATVMVGSLRIQSQTPMPTAKEAEQKVAFEALMNPKFLATDEKGMQLTESFPAKMPILQTAAVTKLMETNNEEHSESYKSKLNEYIQRSKLPPARYEVDKCPAGFIATAVVQGRRFSSLYPLQKRKQAEQNAAHVALVSLGLLQSPTHNVNQSKLMEKRVAGPTSETLMARRQFPIDVPLSQRMFKNMLQEYQQKRGGQLPDYNTVAVAIDGIPGFRSIVTIEHGSFSGDIRKSKKEAEQSSAYRALLDLNILQRQ